MQIIASLKNTSTSTHEVPVRIIKKLGVTLADVIAKLVNKSFISGIFPDILKIAKIIPIYKSGGSQNVANYRPISILPIFSKVFERCVAQRLINFYNKFKLISPEQYGFLRGKSTADAVLQLTEHVYK